MIKLYAEKTRYFLNKNTVFRLKKVYIVFAQVNKNVNGRVYYSTIIFGKQNVILFLIHLKKINHSFFCFGIVGCFHNAPKFDYGVFDVASHGKIDIFYFFVCKIIFLSRVVDVTTWCIIFFFYRKLDWLIIQFNDKSCKAA